MTDFSKDRPMVGVGGPDAGSPPLQLGHDIYAKYGHSPGVLASAASIGVARRAILFGMERLPLLNSIQRRLGGNVLPGNWPTLHYVWALSHAPSGYKLSQTIVSRSALTPARLPPTSATIERKATPLTPGSIPSISVAELPPQSTSLHGDARGSGVQRQRESSVQAVDASVETVHLTHDTASNVTRLSGESPQHLPGSIIHRSADIGSSTAKENLRESSESLQAADHVATAIANPHAPQTSALISPSVNRSATTTISEQVSPSNLVHRESALGEVKTFSPGLTETPYKSTGKNPLSRASEASPSATRANTRIESKPAVEGHALPSGFTLPDHAGNPALLQRSPARNVSDAHSITAPDHRSTPAVVQRPIFARGRTVVSTSSMQHSHTPTASVSTSSQQRIAQNLIEEPLLSRSVADESVDKSACDTGAAFVQLNSTQAQTRSSLPGSTEGPMVQAEIPSPLSENAQAGAESFSQDSKAASTTPFAVVLGNEIYQIDALSPKTGLVHRKSEDASIERGARILNLSPEWPVTSSVSLPKLSLPETSDVIQRPMTIGEAHSATIVSRFAQVQSAEVMSDVHSTPYSRFVQRLSHDPASAAVMPKREASISSLGKEVSAQKTSMVMLDSASTANHTVLASTLPSPTESTAEGVSSALLFNRDNFAEGSSPKTFSAPRLAAQGLVHKSPMFPAVRGYRATSPSLHRATALTMTHIAAHVMTPQQADTGSSTLPAPQVRLAPSVGPVTGPSTGMPGSTAPASLPAAPSIAKSSTGFDLTQLTNRVYELLVKRLASERQRRGF